MGTNNKYISTETIQTFSSVCLLLLDTEITHIFKNMLLIIQKNYSQIMNFLEQSEYTISGFLLWNIGIYLT